MLDRPNSPGSDPISDLAALTRGHALFSSVLVAGGAWAVRFVPRSTSIKFCVVLAGQCWLQPEGLPAQRLDTNDAFLLTDRRPYRLASDLALTPVDWDGSFVIGDGANVRIAGGRFLFEGTGTPHLIEQLSPVMFAPAGSEVAHVLQWVLERLRSEIESDYAATAPMSILLSNILFVQLLRLHFEIDPARGSLLAAFADARVGGALRSIQQNPLRRWTVAGLAREAGVSRSSFAAHFKRLVGIAPFSYALERRMQVAERELLAGDATVAVIAQTLGYQSESAFSAAFKRTTGLPPARYRMQRAFRSQ